MALKNFKIAHVNVRSLLPSFQDFKNILLEYDFSIVGLSETWLNKHIDNSHVAVDGYQLLRNDRDSRGGGVAFYINNTLNYKIINFHQGTEQLWVATRMNKLNYVVGVVYRPQHCHYTDFINTLEDYLSEAVSTADAVVLLGDFNIDLNVVGSLQADALVDAVATFGLVQIIETPTRITQTRSSLIDLIFVSDRNLVLESGAREVHLADHELIYCSLKVDGNLSQGCMRTYRSLKYFDYNLFREDLLQTPFYLIYDINNVNEMAEMLNDFLTSLLDRHMPLVSAKFTRPPAPWITDTIKVMQKIRDNALKKFKKSNLPAHWDYYKSLRNLTTDAIRREKRAYFEYTIKKCNQNKKDMWKVLKTANVIHKHTTKVPDHLSDTDSINNFFLNSIPLSPLDLDLYNEYIASPLNTNDFNFEPTTDFAVFNIIRSIKSNSAGVDGLTIKFIELCCPHILPYIVYVINSCLAAGIFPNCWKRSLVIPLPKRATVAQLSDLRPISILPIVSKIAEKVIELQLKEYVAINEILPVRQSGFRKGYSCCTALLGVVDDIVGSTDEGKMTLMCLLDYTKAFDTLDHRLMSAILRHIGLGFKSVDLLYSFLTKREQCVSVAGRMSSYLPTVSGVPQGSVLGPLLYSIYTSAFAKSLQFSNCHFYADDTQLCISFAPDGVTQACTELNDDIQRLDTLSKKHSLRLNPAKTELILFGPKKFRRDANFRDNIIIRVGNNTVALKESVKNLGVMIDEGLNFGQHINMCINRGYLALKQIYASRNFLNRGTKQLLCESLVLSHMNFCDALYHACISAASVARIQRLQNSCLRLVYGIRRREHISHKLHDIGWLNMRNRRLLHSACLYYNIVLTGKPPYLSSRLRFRADVHNLNIRYKGTLTPPMHRFEYFKRCFSYQIVNVYNSIPLEIKSATSYFSFKRKFRQFLFSRQQSSSE